MNFVKISIRVKSWLAGRVDIDFEGTIEDFEKAMKQI